MRGTVDSEIKWLILRATGGNQSWDGKTRVIQPLTLDVADGGVIVMVRAVRLYEINVVADGGHGLELRRDQRRYLD